MQIIAERYPIDVKAAIIKVLKQDNLSVDVQRDLLDLNDYCNQIERDYKARQVIIPRYL